MFKKQSQALFPVKNGDFITFLTFTDLNSSTMVEDWAKLPKDLLHIISKSLNSSFDLLHFRSVCSSWRSSTEPKRLLPTYHLPILPGNGFFSKSAVGYRLLQRSILLIKPHEPLDSFGWLIKIEEDIDVSRKMNILNPLSCNSYKLPKNFPCSLDMSKFKVRELCREFKLHYYTDFGDIVDTCLYLGKVVVKYLDSDAEDYRFVLLMIHLSGKLAVFKSWDQTWTLINDDDMITSPYENVILFNECFFAVDGNGRTVVVDLSSLKLTLAASPVFGGGDKKFLIESCGEMLLVDLYLSTEAVDGFKDSAVYMNERVVKFKVYKFVVGEKSWVEVKDLGDKMLFVGEDSTFSVSASDILPRCARSSVFLNGCVFKQDLGVFDFMTGKIKRVQKLPPYAKLFWPPPPWITSPECAEDNTGETSSSQC